MSSKTELMQVLTDNEYGSTPHSLKLEDLLLMQMTSKKFKSFINALPKSPEDDFSEVDNLIELAREDATSLATFSKMIKHTRSSQVGNKYSAIRELAQNARDSYLSQNIAKVIRIDTSPQNPYCVLSVTDTGIGMNLKDVVKDLLIPLNSLKEFDMEKIGEHGIGWYSCLDFAEVVQVLTQSEDSSYQINAVVRTEDEEPVADIQLLPGKEKSGTTVKLFIPMTETSSLTLNRAIYQYLGYVPQKESLILLNNTPINVLDKFYTYSKGIPVELDGVVRNLRMGFSDREDDFRYSDEFYQRDKSFHNMVFTQAGLLIKYDAPTFKVGSIHAQLYNNLNDMGVDFQVEVPKNAVLTKGRNNIIDTHRLEVEDATYAAFEDLFLNGILPNQDIMSDMSEDLAKTIAGVLEDQYEHYINKFNEEEFSLQKRIYTSLVKKYCRILEGGQKAVTFLGEIGSDVYSWLGRRKDGVVDWIKSLERPSLPKFKDEQTGGVDWRDVLGFAGLYTGMGLATAGIVNGLYWVQETYGWGPILKGTAITLMGVALLGFGAHLHEDLQGVDVKERVKSTPRRFKNKLFKELDIYQDVEKKKAKKLEELRLKLAKKYVSRGNKGSFFNRLTEKRTIPALYRAEGKNLDMLMNDEYAEEVTEQKKVYLGLGKGFGYEDVPLIKTLISMDELIVAYMSNKLGFMGEKGWDKEDYASFYVDPKHVLVEQITSKLKKSKAKIRQKQDVRVLEEYIESAVKISKSLGLFLASITPPGMLYIAYRTHKDLKEMKSWDPKPSDKEREERANKIGGLLKSANWYMNFIERTHKGSLKRSRQREKRRIKRAVEREAKRAAKAQKLEELLNSSDSRFTRFRAMMGERYSRLADRFGNFGEWCRETGTGMYETSGDLLSTLIENRKKTFRDMGKSLKCDYQRWRTREKPPLKENLKHWWFRVTDPFAYWIETAYYHWRKTPKTDYGLEEVNKVVESHNRGHKFRAHMKVVDRLESLVSQATGIKKLKPVLTPVDSWKTDREEDNSDKHSLSRGVVYFNDELLHIPVVESDFGSGLQDTWFEYLKNDWEYNKKQFLILEALLRAKTEQTISHMKAQGQFKNDEPSESQKHAINLAIKDRFLNYLNQNNISWRGYVKGSIKKCKEPFVDESSASLISRLCVPSWVTRMQDRRQEALNKWWWTHYSAFGRTKHFAERKGLYYDENLCSMDLKELVEFGDEIKTDSNEILYALALDQ